MEYMTREYTNELLMRYKSGGVIWLIEKTDTHEFYIAPGVEVNSTPNYYHEINCMWSLQINEMVVMSGFLSKEDADAFSWTKQGISKYISVDVFEHEFIPS